MYWGYVGILTIRCGLDSNLRERSSITSAHFGGQNADSADNLEGGGGLGQNTDTVDALEGRGERVET